jgi:hypothetical protein
MPKNFLYYTMIDTSVIWSDKGIELGNHPYDNFCGHVPNTVCGY